VFLVVLVDGLLDDELVLHVYIEAPIEAT